MYKKYGDISYGPHSRQKLDLYVPVQTPAVPRPLIVWIYGGSWSSGDKKDYAFIASWLTARGYTVAIPDYRLYPEIIFPDFLADLAASIKTLDNFSRTTPGAADPSRIILMAHSAGAYNAAMLALDQQWLRQAGVDNASITAFIGLAGPYDFFPYDVDATKNVFGHVQDPHITQPIHHVTGDAPPMLLLHGLDDDTVQLRNSEALVRAMRQHNRPVTLITLDGVNHTGILAALSPLLKKESVTGPIERFLSEF